MIVDELSGTILISNFRLTLLLMAVVAASIGCQQSSTVIPPASTGTTFGHRQFDQMLADRPSMHAAVPDTHPVREWLVDAFNGKLIGQRVYWNADPPLSGHSAEHSAAYEQYPPQIRIANDSSSPIDKWASAVYEMFNMSNTEKFEDVQNKALAGDIDADEYAEKCVIIEYDGLLQTKEYFNENPLPDSSIWIDTWYCWVVDVEDTYQEYKLSHGTEPGAHGNYWYFKQYYVDEIVPYQERSR